MVPQWGPPVWRYPLLGSIVGCVNCKLKFSYARNNQEHATGDGSHFITTRRAVPCSGRRVGAARPCGSSPPCPISLVQPVVGSHVQVRRSGISESTSAPQVVLVINVNISLVGLTLLPSMFQISSTMECHGLEDVEPLQDAKDKGLDQASSSRLFILYFSDPRSH